MNYMLETLGTTLLKPFAWLLTWMYNLVGNYGVALFLFAVLVKIILFPFSLKGKKNMIQSSMISEEVKKLQKMYGKNREKYTEEVLCRYPADFLWCSAGEQDRRSQKPQVLLYH